MRCLLVVFIDSSIFLSFQENILINVTAGTLFDSQLQDANYLQVSSRCERQAELLRRRRRTQARREGPRMSGDVVVVVVLVPCCPQIKLNISVGEEQVLVNDIPVELSGVTRLTCQALLREFPHSASVRRVMNHWETTERCNPELAKSSSQINSKTKHG